MEARNAFFCRLQSFRGAEKFPNGNCNFFGLRIYLPTSFSGLPEGRFISQCLFEVSRPSKNFPQSLAIFPSLENFPRGFWRFSDPLKNFPHPSAPFPILRKFSSRRLQLFRGSKIFPKASGSLLTLRKFSPSLLQLFRSLKNFPRGVFSYTFIYIVFVKTDSLFLSAAKSIFLQP